MKTAYLQTKESYLLDGQRFENYTDCLEYCSKRGLRITSTQALRNGRFLLSTEPINHIENWLAGVLSISRKQFN